MSQEKRQICPQCSQLAAISDNDFRPFCSKRCQLVDLGRWLDEDYRIPDPFSDVSAPGDE